MRTGLDRRLPVQAEYGHGVGLMSITDNVAVSPPQELANHGWGVR